MTGDLADGLIALGFSTYDARAYVGLLREGPQTGYALANTTGIPQPKIYEALRRLHQRGAAIRVGEHPVRYAALPPEKVLERLEESFRERLRAAKAATQTLVQKQSEWLEPLTRFDSLSRAQEHARRLLGSAEQKVFLSGWQSELASVADDVGAAQARGVEIVALHFGDLPFELANGCAYRHASTEGVLYRSHRARHLTVIADSQEVLWALAPDGDRWGGTASTDPLIVAVVKDFVRHDIYVQKIYDKLAPELHGHFGPGLELLTNISAEPALPQRKRRAQDRAHG